MEHLFFYSLRWQFIQRFMDVTQPLPDVPSLEPYRHLDPVTAEHDKTTGRPERYWRDKSMKEINALAEELAKDESKFLPAWPAPWPLTSKAGTQTNPCCCPSRNRVKISKMRNRFT